MARHTIKSERKASELPTSKGTWNVYGICFILSDSIAQIIRGIIETGIVTAEIIQKELMHNGPITVDASTRTIYFFGF